MGVGSRDWARDTHDKARLYAAIESVQLYVVIEQHNRHILVFDREGLDAQRPRDEHDVLRASVTLPTGEHELALPLAELYRGIDV